LAPRVKRTERWASPAPGSRTALRRPPPNRAPRCPVQAVVRAAPGPRTPPTRRPRLVPQPRCTAGSTRRRLGPPGDLGACRLAGTSATSSAALATAGRQPQPRPAL